MTSQRGTGWLLFSDYSRPHGITLRTAADSYPTATICCSVEAELPQRGYPGGFAPSTHISRISACCGKLACATTPFTVRSAYSVATAAVLSYFRKDRNQGISSLECCTVVTATGRTISAIIISPPPAQSQATQQAVPMPRAPSRKPQSGSLPQCSESWLTMLSYWGSKVQHVCTTRPVRSPRKPPSPPVCHVSLLAGACGSWPGPCTYPMPVAYL